MEVSPETSTWGIPARPQKPETGSRVCSSPFPIFQCTCTIHNRAPAEIRATSSSSSSFSWPSLPPPGAAGGGVSTPMRLPPVLGTVTRRRSHYFSGSGRQESQGCAVWRRGWDSNPQRPRGLAVFKTARIARFPAPLRAQLYAKKIQRHGRRFRPVRVLLSMARCAPRGGSQSRSFAGGRCIGAGSAAMAGRVERG